MEQKVDLFTSIHKAIRALLYQTASALQAADLGEEQSMQETLRMLENTLDMLEEHAAHEDHLIFPEVEKVLPGTTLACESEHRAYEQKEISLRNLMAQIRKAQTATDRLAFAGALNRAYTDFMAFQLQHMNHEEEQILPLAQQSLENQELLAIRGKIQASIAPERQGEWLRLMLPALNVSELMLLFTQLKTQAPPAVYQNFRELGFTVLDEKRWQQLKAVAAVE